MVKKVETEFEEYLQELGRKRFGPKDIPFYEAGKPPSVERLHNWDYLEWYDKVQGQKWGVSGIGKLRDVLMSRVTSAINNVFEVYGKDAGQFYRDRYDVRKFVEELEGLGQVLKDNGVRVHWIDFLERPMSPFGPMSSMWGVAECLVVRGGTIIPRLGMYPLGFGRPEWIARWLFWHLGITPLLTIIGKGVCEIGSAFFIAENVFVAGSSAAFNQEGLDQLIPVLKRVGVKEVKIIHCPTLKYVDYETGCCAHPNIVCNVLDIGKVIVYPPGVDFEFLKWLKENKIEMVEVERDEQLKRWPCGMVLLEPGKVIMPEGAVKSIRQVRKLGVDVIEFPARELARGVGIGCAVGLLRRDPGPTLPAYE